MSVTVDHEPLAVEQLGLRTIGQVLAHLRRGNRLVVQVLIDGKEPEHSRIKSIKRFPVTAHTIYIQTTDPRRMAAGVLDEVELQLRQADRLRDESLAMLGRNQPASAMERLAGCFSTWQHAQETVLKTAQLLRIDLSCVRVQGRAFTDLLADFTAQLREIRSALEERDFGGLARLLRDHTSQVCAQWYEAIESLKQTIASPT
jgi:hypothetical protein